MTDASLQESLDHKLMLIRTWVRSVQHLYCPGLMVYGPGGVGKTWTIMNVLESSGLPFAVTNSRISAKGLVHLLQEAPSLTHLIDDSESIFMDPHAVGVLRSALWGPVDDRGRMVRIVTWQTANGRETVDFSFGGLIFASNLPIEATPTGRALKSRLAYVEYKPTNTELTLLLRRIAAKGHWHNSDFLDPLCCNQVVDAIVAATQRLERSIDLRWARHAFQDYLLWKNGLSDVHWHDLLEARIKAKIIPSTMFDVPQREKDHEFAVIARIVNLPRQEMLSIWMKETSKSQASLYRRLAEYKAMHSSNGVAG